MKHTWLLWVCVFMFSCQKNSDLPAKNIFLNFEIQAGLRMIETQTGILPTGYYPIVVAWVQSGTNKMMVPM